VKAFGRRGLDEDLDHFLVDWKFSGPRRGVGAKAEAAGGMFQVREDETGSAGRIEAAQDTLSARSAMCPFTTSKKNPGKGDNGVQKQASPISADTGGSGGTVP